MYVDIPPAPAQETAMMQTLSLVALGGAIGSVLRYLAFGLIAAPLGTLGVNVLGSFLIGVLYVVLVARSPVAHLLMTGVLGGFTTFSTFSLDTIKMWEAGQGAGALGYVLGSVILSVLAAAAGMTLARGIWA